MRLSEDRQFKTFMVITLCVVGVCTVINLSIIGSIIWIGHEAAIEEQKWQRVEQEIKEFCDEYEKQCKKDGIEPYIKRSDRI